MLLAFSEAIELYSLPGDVRGKGSSVFRSYIYCNSNFKKTKTESS